MSTDIASLEQLEAAVARIEGEKQSRLQAKIDAGEAVRVRLSVIVDAESEIHAKVEQAQADKLAELRSAGEQREVHFDTTLIATGVPRGADSYVASEHEPGEAIPPSTSSEPPREPEEPAVGGATLSPPSRPAYIQTTTRQASDEGDPGEIAEGLYSVEGNALVLTELDGQYISGRAPLPNQNPEAVARALLREASETKDFNKPIVYPSSGAF